MKRLAQNIPWAIAGGLFVAQMFIQSHLLSYALSTTAMVMLGINAAFVLWPIANRIYRNVIIVLSVLLLSGWVGFYLQAEPWAPFSVANMVLSIVYIALTFVRTIHNAFGVFTVGAILLACAAFISPITPPYPAVVYVSLIFAATFGALRYITKPARA